MLLNFRFVATT